MDATLLQNGSATSPLPFLMIDVVDHITGKTGLSPTVTISKNSGAFAAPAGAVTEIGNGWYKVAGNATDTNTNGTIALHAEATGADPFDGIVAQVVGYSPNGSIPVAGSGVMYLTEARKTACAGVRVDPLADDETTRRIDMALQHCGNLWTNAVGVPRRSSTITITANADRVAIDTSTFPDFLPGFILSIRDAAMNAVELVDFERIRRLRLDTGTTTTASIIEAAGFETEGYIDVFPRPSANLDLTVIWTPPFTSWDPEDTLGLAPTVDPDSLALSIPRRLIYPVLDGAAAFYIASQMATNPKESEGWKRFEASIKDAAEQAFTYQRSMQNKPDTNPRVRTRDTRLGD